MKRYAFRLAAVLRIRRAEEEKAREALSQANAALARAVRHREFEVARYDAIALSISSSGATTIEGLRGESQSSGLVASVVSAATAGVVEAEGVVARTRDAWIDASRRVKVLEQLDERRRHEHDIAEQRGEIAVVDDIVTTRFVALQHRAQRESAQRESAQRQSAQRGSAQR